jgi:hypothetical protein
MKLMQKISTTLISYTTSQSGTTFQRAKTVASGWSYRDKALKQPRSLSSPSRICQLARKLAPDGEGNLLLQVAALLWGIVTAGARAAASKMSGM